jgi:hypothetical protein
MMESSRQECAVPRECQNDGDEDHAVSHACSCIVHAVLNSGKDVSGSYGGGIPWIAPYQGVGRDMLAEGNQWGNKGPTGTIRNVLLAGAPLFQQGTSSA